MWGAPGKGKDAGGEGIILVMDIDRFTLAWNHTVPWFVFVRRPPIGLTHIPVHSAGPVGLELAGGFCNAPPPTALERMDEQCRSRSAQQA